MQDVLNIQLTQKILFNAPVSLWRMACNARNVRLSVLTVYTNLAFYISICISTLPTQHTMFISRKRVARILNSLTCIVYITFCLENEKVADSNLFPYPIGENVRLITSFTLWTRNTQRWHEDDTKTDDTKFPWGCFTSIFSTRRLCPLLRLPFN